MPVANRTCSKDLTLSSHPLSLSLNLPLPCPSLSYSHLIHRTNTLPKRTIPPRRARRMLYTLSHTRTPRVRARASLDSCVRQSYALSLFPLDKMCIYVLRMYKVCTRAHVFKDRYSHVRAIIPLTSVSIDRTICIGNDLAFLRMLDHRHRY